MPKYHVKFPDGTISANFDEIPEIFTIPDEPLYNIWFTNAALQRDCTNGGSIWRTHTGPVNAGDLLNHFKDMYLLHITQEQFSEAWLVLPTDKKPPRCAHVKVD